MVKQSMNAFLQQAGTLLYRYLRKRGLAHEDAEDIVQDTCYKFYYIKWNSVRQSNELVISCSNQSIL